MVFFESGESSFIFFLLSNVDHVAEIHRILQGLFQHGYGVQIMVRVHGRLRKGVLYHVAEKC